MIDKIKKLGEDNDDISAIISFGSLHLCDMSKIDEFSDLDIFIFTTNPSKYLDHNHPEWLAYFGNPISVLAIINPIENNMITRVMLDNYFSLDVIPISFNKFNLIKFYIILKKLKINRVLKNYARIESEIKTFYSYLMRGYSILYDKKNITKLIHRIENIYKNVEDIPLTEKTFHECYNDFWQIAYKFLGLITRDDTYYAMVRLDNVLKRRLIKMIEWESQVYYKNSSDTYFHAKKINQWANPEINEELKGTMFTLNKEKDYAILNNHLKIFKKVSRNVSISKGYDINTILEDKISERLFHYMNKLNE